MTLRTTRCLRTIGACAALHVLAGCMTGDTGEGEPGETDARERAGQIATAHGDAGAHAGHSIVDAGKMAMMDGGMSGHDGMPGHAGMGDGGPSESGDAICPPNFPRVAPAVTKVGNLTVKVVSLTPRPPRQKVQNDWELEITDDTGAPVAGAGLLNPDSYMEVHRHYGKRPPVVQPLETPGHYLLDNIDFSMRGPWEVLFNLLPQGADKATRFAIKVCVE
jgi:hypothetical protein